MEDKPKTMGRPSKYSQELADTICLRLACGESMRSVCRDSDMPSMQTMWTWLREKPDFLEQYERAKQESADAMSEDALALADESAEVIVGDDRSDSARVQAKKLQVDTRKWLMAKMKPKKYGDKVDVTSGGKPLPLLGGITRDTDNDGDQETGTTPQTD